MTDEESLPSSLGTSSENSTDETEKSQTTTQSESDNQVVFVKLANLVDLKGESMLEGSMKMRSEMVTQKRELFGWYSW